MLKEHLDYLKDNPHHYWFKAKLYGWGWVPATWQGWLVILVYLILLTLLGLTLDETSSAREVIFLFVLPVILLTITLIRICYRTGEKPRWQWGPPKKKD